MSDRTIVALGVWLLVLVLIGTIMLGSGLPFYLAVMAAGAITAITLLVVVRRRRRPDQDQPRPRTARSVGDA